jgi:hypothetical protein
MHPAYRSLTYSIVGGGAANRERRRWHWVLRCHDLSVSVRKPSAWWHEAVIRILASKFKRGFADVMHQAADRLKASRREWMGLAVIALPCMLYSIDPDRVESRAAEHQRGPQAQQ